MKIKSTFLIIILIISLMTMSFPAFAMVQGGQVGAVLDSKLASVLLDTIGPVQVIVTFHGDGPVGTENIQLLKSLGITTGLTLQSLPMVGVLATQSQIETLSQNPNIRSIYLNSPLKYYNYDATALTGVDKLRADQNMTRQNGGMPVSGKGVTVVVNDSGVDGTHRDHQFGSHLVQNVMGTTNLNSLVDILPITYVENVINTDTNSGHGTHVAGTVGGTGAMSGGKYEGVAPGANLVGYGSGAALLILDAIGGFDYALTHQYQYGIRVITNSWGSSGDFDPENPVNIASKLAYDRGIVVTFAAGNEGPGEDTHNPYAKAPWVISVAAGDKEGRLADFSSRGTKGVGGTFMLDGETWTWEDRPTITAPGVNIISTRVLAPVASLGAPDDIEFIEPAYLPFYTTMSGTSMATPHVAGIVALMLEANPSLSPSEVKQILQDTATNMPGMEAWEVGAGYINAYAAVDQAFQRKNYGQTLNLNRTFNSNVNVTTTRTPFTVDYSPLTLVSKNQHSFTVPTGLTELVARIDAFGVSGETGNPVNLVLIAPDRTEYSSGVNLLFALYPDRTVSVPTPMPGEWKAEVRGLKGVAENPTHGISFPEQINGTLTFKVASGFSGLNDIAGHPAEGAIKIAVSEHLVDGYSDQSFKPNQFITRKELANYLVMGAAIRQSLPNGSSSFTDVDTKDTPFVEAVVARGAAMKDKLHIYNGVMLPTSTNKFAPNQSVTRLDLAYSLVQSLGLQDEAVKRNNNILTVQFGDQRVPITDASLIPVQYRGYVQLALDLNIVNAYFTIKQGPYDLIPIVSATFNPTQKVTRSDYAVAITRFFSAFLAP